MGFPGGSVVENPSDNAGDVDLIPSWEDPLEKEMATPSNILAWETPMNWGACWATVCGVTNELDTT